MEIDSKVIKVQAWDTAGQERYRTITTSYYKGAHGIMLVYDVGDKNSFGSVRNWIEQIEAVGDILYRFDLILLISLCVSMRLAYF